MYNIFNFFFFLKMQISDFVSFCQRIYTRDQICLPLFLYVVVGGGAGSLGLRKGKQGGNEMFFLHSRWHKPHYHIIAQMSSLPSSFLGLGVAWLGLSHFPWSSLGRDQFARHKLNNFVHTVDALNVLLGHISKKKKKRQEIQIFSC